MATGRNKVARTPNFVMSWESFFMASLLPKQVHRQESLGLLFNNNPFCCRSYSMLHR